MDLEFSEARCNLIGGIVAIAALVLTNGVFILRLAKKPGAEHLVGLLLILLLLPLSYLLVSSFYLSRPGIYRVWVGLMTLFLVVELLLDYVFHLPFREVRWQAIAYVMLFFAALGGMIGVASLAGRRWAIAATMGFWVTVVFAFVQRRITGM